MNGRQKGGYKGTGCRRVLIREGAPGKESWVSHVNFTSFVHADNARK